MNKNKSELELSNSAAEVKQSDVVESAASSKLSTFRTALQAAYASRLLLKRELLAQTLKKPHLLRKNRREIARLKTVLHAQASKE